MVCFGASMCTFRSHCCFCSAEAAEVRLEPANRQMENEAAVLRDAAADAQAVYTFVGWMLVIGALTLVAVQRRKLKSASLYDRRSKA